MFPDEAQLRGLLKSQIKAQKLTQIQYTLDIFKNILCLTFVFENVCSPSMETYTYEPELIAEIPTDQQITKLTFTTIDYGFGNFRLGKLTVHGSNNSKLASIGTVKDKEILAIELNPGEHIVGAHVQTYAVIPIKISLMMCF